MELRPLESFLAVISAGSVTAAARAIGRSQPVVTRHIQELEAEIGFDLFTRNGPRITPTERGLRFHAEVERLITGMKQLSERAAAIANSAPLAIEVAAIPALATGLLPRALSCIDDRLMPQTAHIRSAPAEQVVQSVLARNADLGVASLPLDHPGIEIIRLYKANCVVAIPASHPLARRDVIAISDLGGLTLIGMANPFRLRHRVESALAAAAVSVGRIISTNATVTALQLVRNGVGVAVVEPVTALGLPLDGVVIRPLDVGIPFLWGAVTALHAPRSETVFALLASLDAATRDLLPDAEILDPGNDPQRLAEASESVSQPASRR